MLVDYSNDISTVNTPFDLAYMRRQVLEYHKLYGMPAVIKHAYGIDDIALGNAVRDNTYESAYGQSFVEGDVEGTGFSEESAFTFITLDDSMIDDQSPSERGAYKLLQPTGVAPWTPILHDNDLLILVEVTIDEDYNITVVETGDRFRLQNIQPITERGRFHQTIQRESSNYLEDKEHFVSQRFQAIRIPRSDPLYEVEI